MKYTSMLPKFNPGHSLNYPASKHHTSWLLVGTIDLNRKEAKVLFDTGTIGDNIVSTHFVGTHRIPCIEMAQPM